MGTLEAEPRKPNFPLQISRIRHITVSDYWELNIGRCGRTQAMIFIPYFVKVYQLTENLKWKAQNQTA